MLLTGIKWKLPKEGDLEAFQAVKDNTFKKGC